MKLKKIENAVVHCKTKEEAEVLIKNVKSKENPDLWIIGFVYFGEAVCYEIVEGVLSNYGSIGYYKKCGCEITEFCDLIEQEETPKLTAEKVVEWIGNYYGDEAVMNEIVGNDYSLDGLGRNVNTKGVGEIISRWKFEHEKKEPEIETVDICRIIEIRPDGRKRRVHEEDLASGSTDAEIKIMVEAELKRYCMEHEGEFIAVHEVVSRVKKD